MATDTLADLQRKASLGHLAAANIKTVDGGDPGVGTEHFAQVPAGKFWRLLGARTTLVTNATAGTRRVKMRFADAAGLVFCDAISPSTQPISTTKDYSFVVGVPSVADADNVIAVQIPALILPAGFRIATVTAAISAGDNYSQLVLLVEEVTL